MKKLLTTAMVTCAVLGVSSAFAADVTYFKRVAAAYTCGDIEEYEWDIKVTQYESLTTCDGDCRIYNLPWRVVLNGNSCLNTFKVSRITGWFQKSGSTEYYSKDWDFINETNSWGAQDTQYVPWTEDGYLIYKADRRYDAPGAYWYGDYEVRFNAYYTSGGSVVRRRINLDFDLQPVY